MSLTLLLLILFPFSLLTRKTVFLFEIFRHGTRRETMGLQSLQDYPDDHTGIGDLTPVGARQEYLLGKALRQKYSTFFETVTHPSHISMTSSFYNRTITSGISQLAGLFDLGSGGNLESDNKQFYMPPIPNWDYAFPDGTAALPRKARIIPIEVSSFFHNYVFTPDNEVNCNYMKIQRSLKFEEMRKLDTHLFEPLWQKLVSMGYHSRDYTKNKNEQWDIISGFNICDIILSKTSNDPDFSATDEILYTQCLYLSTYQIFRLHSGDHFNLVNQKLNQRITKILKNVLEGKRNGLKVALFSSHDSNLAIFLNNFFPNQYLCVLEAYQDKFGPTFENSESPKVSDGFCLEIMRFSANIVLEVYEADDQLYVEFLVNNVRVDLDYTKKDLTLRSLINVLENNTTDKWDQICAEDRGIERLSNPLIFFTILTFAGLIYLTIAYLRAIAGKKVKLQPGTDIRQKLVL